MGTTAIQKRQQAKHNKTLRILPANKLAPDDKRQQAPKPAPRPKKIINEKFQIQRKGTMNVRQQYAKSSLSMENHTRFLQLWRSPSSLSDLIIGMEICSWHTTLNLGMKMIIR
jgi:hypothetical protein